jgi:hypothetical protein
MRTRLAATIAAGAALLAPSGAAAGGFATVGVDPVPDGIGPGKVWEVRLTILQHGRTPLEYVNPQVIVERGSVRRAFAARATRQPGVYRARVVFPSAGTWQYVVDDGFTKTHTFAPVRVATGGGGKTPVAASATSAAPPGSSDGGGPDIQLALAVAAVAGLGAALGSAALQGRRPRPAGG